MHVDILPEKPLAADPPQWQWWLLAARPKTLTAGAAPVVLASVLAARLQGSFSLFLFICSLVAALLIQVGINLVNDALDFRKGADTEERLGPLRVTQAGVLAFSQVLGGGFLCFALAFIFGIPLMLQGGLPLVALFFLSIIFGYLYTGGPYPLAYVGLGDLFVLLFFGWLSTLGVYLVQAGSIGWAPFLAGTQIGLLATVILAVNNLRDIKSDRKARKRTLAVRWGETFAKGEITFMILFPFMLNFFWLAFGHPFAAVFPLAALPLGIWLILSVWRHEPSELYNRFLALGALLHACFALLLTVGLFL